MLLFSILLYAGVAKSVDAADSKSATLKSVSVRVRPPAPLGSQSTPTGVFFTPEIRYLQGFSYHNVACMIINHESLLHTALVYWEEITLF